MWWVISLISLIVLGITEMMTTFVLLIVLNGYPTLPENLVAIYVVTSCGLLPTVSLLNGLLAKKLSENPSRSLENAGIMTITISVLIVPIILFVLAFGLLAIFGQL